MEYAIIIPGKRKEESLNLTDEEQLREHRDWLLNELKAFTPDVLYGMMHRILGAYDDRFEPAKVRKAWYGWPDGEDDPINLARALDGLVGRLRDESLDREAVLELEMLYYHLDNLFYELDMAMREEATTHGAN